MKKIFTILGVVGAMIFADAQIVISEVYGGGGGATATYKNDFVELKNIGTSEATLANGVIQYASATGAFNSYIVLPENITLAPGQKYLIEMVPKTANTSGVDLPTADFQATKNTSFADGKEYDGGLNLAAKNGKIALTNGVERVQSVVDAPFIVDFVGYGTANMYEGTGAVVALDATTSATRTAGDTNNNATDFQKVTPTPENMATSLSTNEVSFAKINFVKNTVVTNEVSFLKDAKVQIINLSGQVVKSASVKENQSLNVSELPKGVYIVTGVVDGKAVSQKIIKK